MKAFIVLTVCLVAVSAGPVLEENGNSTAEEDEALKQCFKKHNINPDIIAESNDSNTKVNPIALLTDEEKGCFNACMYTTYKWMKPDGTLDFDDLFEGAEKTIEGRFERKTYEIGAAACRAAAGNDNCRFFQCFSKIKVPSIA